MYATDAQRTVRLPHSDPIFRTLTPFFEFLGEAFTSWLKINGLTIKYIQPGKPNQNALIERFNRTFLEEMLDQHLFARLDDLREATH